MKKYFYFIVEGIHDTAALWRFLKIKELQQVKKFSDLDHFWTSLVPKNYPHEDNLLGRMPVPTFYQNKTTSIAIRVAGSDTK